MSSQSTFIHAEFDLPDAVSLSDPPPISETRLDRLARSNESSLQPAFLRKVIERQSNPYANKDFWKPLETFGAFLPPLAPLSLAKLSTQDPGP